MLNAVALAALTILPLVASAQVFRCKRLKADEDAAQSSFCGALDEVSTRNGIFCCCTLEETPHAFHAFKERFRNASITEQMIVEDRIT
jgi:hypothetical protein